MKPTTILSILVSSLFGLSTHAQSFRSAANSNANSSHVAYREPAGAVSSSGSNYSVQSSNQSSFTAADYSRASNSRLSVSDYGFGSSANTSVAESRYNRAGNAYFSDNGYYGAASGTGVAMPLSNNYINPGSGRVAAKYSRSMGRYFYYCTSEESRKKCIQRHVDSVLRNECRLSVQDPYRPGDAFSFFGIGWASFGPLMGSVIFPLDFIWVLRDYQMMPDNTARHSNSSQFFSFDGYVVHNTDTLAGVVTITHNAVALDNIQGMSAASKYTNSLKNISLKGITVYKGVKELHLVRLGNDKHLYRVVHNGKLRIYDKSYEFLTPSNVSKKLLIENAATGESFTVSSDAALFEAINKTYNLSIKPDEHSHEELMLIMNRLD